MQRAELLRVHTAGHLARVAAATRAVQEQPDERGLREPQGDGECKILSALTGARGRARFGALSGPRTSIAGPVSEVTLMSLPFWSVRRMTTERARKGHDIASPLRAEEC